MKRNMQIPKEAERKLKYLFPDSEAVFIKAAKSMLSKADRCTCDVPVITYYTRIPDTYQYKCRQCKKVISPLVITPLSRERKGLTETVDLACRLYYAKREISPVIISEHYGCKYETAKRKSNRVIQWMRLALTHSNKPLPNKINNTKVIKIFSKQNNDLTAAIDSLFDSLPSLKVAAKDNSQNQ